MGWASPPPGVRVQVSFAQDGPAYLGNVQIGPLQGSIAQINATQVSFLREVYTQVRPPSQLHTAPGIPALPSCTNITPSLSIRAIHRS